MSSALTVLDELSSVDTPIRLRITTSGRDAEWLSEITLRVASRRLLSTIAPGVDPQRALVRLALAEAGEVELLEDLWEGEPIDLRSFPNLLDVFGDAMTEAEVVRALLDDVGGLDAELRSRTMFQLDDYSDPLAVDVLVMARGGKSPRRILASLPVCELEGAELVRGLFEGGRIAEPGSVELVHTEIDVPEPLEVPEPIESPFTTEPNTVVELARHRDGDKSVVAVVGGIIGATLLGSIYLLSPPDEVVEPRVDSTRPPLVEASAIPAPVVEPAPAPEPEIEAPPPEPKKKVYSRKIAGPDADERLRRAEALIDAGRYRAASRILARLRRELKSDPTVWALSSHLELERGRFMLSMQYVERAIELDPSHYRAWVLKGSTLQFQRRRQDAVAAYKTAVALGPDHPMSTEIRRVVQRLERRLRRR